LDTKVACLLCVFGASVTNSISFPSRTGRRWVSLMS